ncbi:helix-turn-helix domain-containing protein [Nocardia sp. NPDC056611]|uniref:helix-turn-helix domain-containing protein n=1 Tax=Nocardia sp. NPDC056611 TaxID=3345877 RepID=UPI003671720B
MSTQTTNETEWSKYLASLMTVQGVKNSELADAIGVSRSTAGNWLTKGTVPDWKQVKAVALYFGRPISEALIWAGFLTAEELMYVAPPLAPESMSNEQLLLLLQDRLAELTSLRETVAANETASGAGKEKLPPADRAPKTIRGRQGATGRR